MFSGIVSHTGQVAAVDASGEDWRVTIVSDLPEERCELGASIACNGICLTVAERETTEQGRVRFVAQAGVTTRERTTLADWYMGQSLNLEASLRLGDPLDGHLVMGHVDACVRVADRRERENEIGLDFLFPVAKGDDTAKDIRACCAVRGSVALDGVSLTISGCSEKVFSVALIPYTAQHTTLGEKVIGDRVNLEIDVVARYVARRLEIAKAGAGGGA